MSRVSLILPTYNERENIQTLVPRIFAALGDIETVVVDDDSPDRTWEAAQALSEKYPGLKVVRRIGERGLRSAIQRGIETSGGDMVGWLDCDLSMPPEVFVEMLKSMGSADLVVGSRYVSGGRDDRPFLRRIFSTVICRLGSLLLGTRTRDLTSGFILCRRGILEMFPLSGDYGEYCIALIFKAERHGFKVKEVPYRFVDRTQGQSKTYQGLLRFLFLGGRYVIMIGRLFRERISNEQDPHV